MTTMVFRPARASLWVLPAAGGWQIDVELRAELPFAVDALVHDQGLL
jgi:hypothetical protein